MRTKCPPIACTIGTRAGRLVIESTVSPTSKHARTRLLARCDCGNARVVKPNVWRKGDAKSCGCSKYARPSNGGNHLRPKQFGMVTTFDASEARAVGELLRLVQSARWVAPDAAVTVRCNDHTKFEMATYEAST